MNCKTALPGLLLVTSLITSLPPLSLAAGCLNNGCHQEMTNMKHMHGPIGAEMAGVQGCIMCHLPTGPTCSAGRAGSFTLKDKEMCQTCHARGTGSQHTNTLNGCLECHNPHGSDISPYMLRDRQ